MNNNDIVKLAQKCAKTTLFNFISTICWIIIWGFFLIMSILVSGIELWKVIVSSIFIVFNTIFAFKYWLDYKKRKKNYIVIKELNK